MYASILPSEALQAAVIRDLLLEYEESRFSCITSEPAKQDPFWFYLFQHVINVKSSGTPPFPQCVVLGRGKTIEQIYQALTVIRASGVKIVVVHSLSQHSEIMLQIAQSVSLTNLGEDLVWIFTDQAMANDPIHFPKHAIGAAKAYSDEEDMEGGHLHDKMSTLRRLVLHDAVVVLSEALDATLRKVQMKCTQGFLPTEARKFLFREMVDNVYKGKTGVIKFSKSGDRTSYQFTISQVVQHPQGSRKHWSKVGTISQTMETTGGPQLFEVFLQISLPQPRHLRIVTIEQKPFTMVSRPDFSNNMGTSCPSSSSVLCVRYLGNRTMLRSVAMPIHSNQYQEVLCCYGIMIDLLQLLQMQTRFSFELYLVRDGKFGSYDPKTDEMNGMIGDVARGDADMALASMTITRQRYKYVDFSTPFAGTSLAFLVKRQRHATYPFPDWLEDTRLMKPFSAELWLACIAAFLIVATTVFLIEKVTKYRYIRSDYFLPFEYMAYVFGNIFHVPLTWIHAKTHAVPVVMVITNCGALVLVSSYTANLLVSLIVVDDVSIVSGLGDEKLINPPENFKFATIKDSSSVDFFRNSDNAQMRKIYQNMKLNLVNNFSDGVAKIRSGELNAFIAESEGLSYHIAEDTNCSLKLDGELLELPGLAFAFPKNSSWTREISNAILKLNTQDIIDKIFRRWVVIGCKKSNGNPVVAHKMGLGEFGGFLFNTALCGIGCFIILLLEVVFYKKFAKTRRNFNITTKSESAATITTLVHY